MKARTISTGNTPFAVVTIVLVVAIVALVTFTAITLTRSPQIQVQPASSIQSGVNPTLRYQRLLEVNEGIKPVVTAVPIDRNRHLLEVNEGYVPDYFRTPRDQRLYELNR